MPVPFRKKLKRLVRGALRRLGRRRPPEQVSDPATAESYPWNQTFLRLLRRGPGPRRAVYLWGVLQGAKLADALGHERVSVLEFGVAGGRGLVRLENAAEAVEAELDVEIEVYGFDTGGGLPKPVDYRDMPNLYAGGDYSMDVDRLRRRLDRAELVLGDVRDTVPRFLERDPAPVAFAAFDLDLYTSTRDAFVLFEAADHFHLPRVHAYFDDIMGLTCSEWTGERLAIREFNQEHEHRKISPIFGLRYRLPERQADRAWNEMMYMVHLFDHPRYGDYDGLVDSPELPLREKDR